MKIKNWKKFQHFKDRRPPWIKLHRDVLEQRDINMISDRSHRVLIGLWLLASEDEEMQGTLPPVDDIAFRLRKPESEIIESLRELKPFLVGDDINMMSERYQADDKAISLARSRETETEERQRQSLDLSKDKSQPPEVAESDDSDLPFIDPRNAKKNNNHFSKLIPEKQFKSIKSECDEILKLPSKNGRGFNPFQWVQKKTNARGHPQAIFESLTGLLKLWDTVENPWAYIDAAFRTKDGNYNEREHTKQTQAFKKYIDSPKIKKLIQDIGG